MSTVNGLGSSIVNQLSAYQNQKSAKTENSDSLNNAKDSLNVQKNRVASEAHVQEGVELSDGAKKILDELKEKYGNMDFFVSNYSSDEEAQDIMSRGTKEYSVLIDPETLEKMAEDESTKEKYMNLIDESTNKLSEMKDQIEESGEEVETLGVKIDAEGTAKFFATIKQQNEKYQKQVEADKEAAKKAEKEAEEKKAEKAEEEKEKGQVDGGNSGPLNPYAKKDSGFEKKTSVYADSVEELIEKIKNVDWSQVEATPIKNFGQKFDFSV